MKKLVALSTDTTDKVPSQTILFGPWNLNIFEFLNTQNKYDLLTSPYSHDNLKEHQQNISRWCTKLIETNFDKFNTISNQQENLDYWKARITPWLQPFLIMCFEITYKLNQIDEPLEVDILQIDDSKKSIEQSLVLNLVDEHFWNKLVSDAIIAYEHKQIKINRTIAPPAPASNQYKKALSVNSIKEVIRSLFTYITSSSKLQIGYVEGISLLDRMWLYCKYDPLFIFKKRYNPSLINSASFSSKDTISFRSEHCENFDKVVSLIFFSYVPHVLLSKLESYNVPDIFVGLDIYQANIFSYLICKTKSQKKIYISHQHGSGYGQVSAFSSGNIEYLSADHFLTWGWSQNHAGFKNLCAPISSPLLSKLPKKSTQTKEIIYVSTERLRIPYQVQSDIMHFDIFNFYKLKDRFISSLSTKTKSLIRYRPYPTDYNSKSLEYFSKYNLQVVTGSAAELDKKIAKAQLVILDHLGTTLHKTIAMDIPTIAFWNHDQIQLDPHVEKLLLPLYTHGVFHQSAEAAAEFINKLIDEDTLALWWQSTTTQEAVNVFRKYYTKNSPAWRQEWSDFLNNNIPSNSSSTF